MKERLLWVSLVVLAVAPSVALVQRGYPMRSVRPVADVQPRAAAFDPAQSTALFVGVRRFDSTAIAQVPYGVDDAVDLAYAFAMDPRVGLVNAGRVVLALSDKPLKKQSQDRLAALRDAGARITAATQPDILAQLRYQTARVGRDGLLVVAFATHGYTHEGIPYVLAETSELERPDTAISTVRVLEAASMSHAARSLILLDACRDRVKTDARTAPFDPLSAAPLIDAMAHTDSQAVLYAAAAGKYAYDNDQRRNGVFTAAVIDGIHCKAAQNAQGLVTVDALAAYVDREVHTWVREHRPPSESYSAIQVSMDGGTRNMPIARCGDPRVTPTTPLPPRPVRVDVAEAAFTVHDERGAVLFEHEMQAPIAHAELVDLDADGRSEVVVAAAGRIHAFSPTGEELWAGDTNAPVGDQHPAHELTVTTFTGARLYDRRSSEIVALSNAADGSASRITIFDRLGRLRSAYWHPGRLENVIVDKISARHAPRIIVLARNDAMRSDSVFMLDPKRVDGEAPPYGGKPGSGSQLWYGVLQPAGQRIDTITISDFDNDGNRDISIRTVAGAEFHLDFSGRILAAKGRTPAPFGLIASR